MDNKMNSQTDGSDRPFSIVVCILVTLFGMTTFLHVDTISAELPVLVQKLPEYWELPAYFSFIVSVLCTFPPLVYFAVHGLCPSSGGEGEHAVKIICSFLAVGIVSAVLLIVFWNYTSVVSGTSHSTALLCLIFVTGSINYISLLLFVSYMVRLPAVYIPAFHVGEGLGGCAASIVGLIQGAGNYECVSKQLNASTDLIINLNQSDLINYSHSSAIATTNTTFLTEAVYHEPLFSVEGFFGYLLVIDLVCTGSFLALNFLPYCRKFHVGQLTRTLEVTEDEIIEMSDTTAADTPLQREDPPDGGEMRPNTEDECNSQLMTTRSDKNDNLEKAGDSKDVQCIDTKTYYWLLFLTLWIGGVKYGVIDSVQSYSALPYGSVTFSLINRLGLAAIPVSSVMAYFAPTRSITVININAAINLIAAVFIMALVTMSPYPILWDTHRTLGAALVVSSC